MQIPYVEIYRQVAPDFVFTLVRKDFFHLTNRQLLERMIKVDKSEGEYIWLDESTLRKIYYDQQGKITAALEYQLKIWSEHPIKFIDEAKEEAKRERQRNDLRRLMDEIIGIHTETKSDKPLKERRKRKRISQGHSSTSYPVYSTRDK